MANNDTARQLIMPGFANASPTEAKKRTAKKAWKIFWRVVKVLVYLFFFGIGLYGCFQTYADYWTASSTIIGNGLEIGFSPTSGVTDPAYTVIYTGSGPYYTLTTEWTMAYGPFYAFFVYPFAMILLYFMYATRSWPAGLNALLGIFIILFIIRAITMAISARSMLQSEKMTEIQGKIAEINAKYKDVKDPQSKKKKQMETQELYKKHGVRPFAAMEQIFVTLPIFLIIYRIITILRPLKFAIVFNAWDLTQSPISEIFSHFTTTGWPYLFFLILVLPMQFASQFIPRMLAKKRSRNASTVGVKNNQSMKRIKTMNWVLSIFMAIIAIISASGIGTYWFFNSIFSIAQSVIIHKMIMRRRARGVTVKSKLTKFGIE
ncbi:membrane protein insertase YidC [Ureaplasma ceti]|uniref:Membrane protein insertase YidC n=1 Tax=Ureaplasma ceti TaxID=3119530 RepID=A0ABP9U6J2_9BACT